MKFMIRTPPMMMMSRL